MPMLTNSPPSTVLRLEQKQSYSLGVKCKINDTTMADLTGSTLTFVLAETSRYGSAVVVTQALGLPNPTLGDARLYLQADDLDLPAREYIFAITILTPEGYTGLLVKGMCEVQSNVDPTANGTYTGDGTANTITLTLQKNGSLHLHVLPLFQDLSPFVDQAQDAAQDADIARLAAQVAALAAQDSADSAEAFNLTMGTVTTLSPGSSATATITGTYPNLVLNQGIPAGAVGPVSTTPGPQGPPGVKTLAYKRSVVAAGVGGTLLYNDTGAAWTIVSCRASVEAAPSGGSVIVDINKNGTTIFTTQANRPTITTGTLTSGRITNMNVTSVAPGEYLSVDIDNAVAPAVELNVLITVN